MNPNMKVRKDGLMLTYTYVQLLDDFDTPTISSTCNNVLSDPFIVDHYFVMKYF